MSSPEKMMRPLSGRTLPASWLMKVVLPAPFGPMMAWVSPCLTSRLMPSLACSAPKLLCRSRTSRSGTSLMSGEQPGEAALEEQHREHEERPQDHLPVLGPAGEHVLEQQEDRS